MKSTAFVLSSRGLLSCALFFGLAFSLIAHDNEAGVGYVVLALLGVFLSARAFVLTRFQKVLCFLIVLTSVNLCTTGSVPLHALDFLLIGILTLALCARSLTLTSLFRALVTPLIHLFDPAEDIRDMVKESAGHTTDQKALFRRVILPGLCIAIPLFLVVFLLLRSADLVFRTLTNALVPHIDGWDVILYLVLFFFGFLCSYTLWKEHRKGEEVNSGSRTALLSSLTAMIFLVPVLVLYVLFALIQAVFVLSRGTALPSGVTYADYVHEGFYQLTILALLNLVVFFLTQRFFAKTRALKIILVLLSICTYLLDFTGAFRMVLYIGAYQLTFLRLFVLWFMAVIAIVLALLTRRCFVSFRLLPAFLIVGAVSYLVFSFSRPDAIIASWNLSHGSDDAWYLSTLSSDAVPVLKNDPELFSDWIDEHTAYDGNASSASEDDAVYTEYSFAKEGLHYNFANAYAWHLAQASGTGRR